MWGKHEGMRPPSSVRSFASMFRGTQADIESRPLMSCALLRGGSACRTARSCSAPMLPSARLKEFSLPATHL
jgi:hypothetical protein